jgi:hypothetical protein
MRILFLLLSTLYLPIVYADCSLPFIPHTKGYYQPQEMVDQLKAAGWTVTGLSDVFQDPNFPTVQWHEVYAYNPNFTYTYAGVTKGMCDAEKKWELTPELEKQAFRDALGALIEFNPNSYYTVKSSVRDFNSQGLKPQNYAAYNEYASFLNPRYNDWYDDSFDFGYLTKAQHSNGGTRADATQTVIWIDDDIYSWYSAEVFGSFTATKMTLNPVKYKIGESNPFELIFWKANHASIITALGLQIEGLLIDNRTIDYDWRGKYDIVRELNRIAYDPSNTLQVVAMPNGTDDVVWDTGLEAIKSAIAITKNKVMVSAAMNEIHSGTDCQIGNYWVFGYDSPIGYQDGYCISKADYNARWTTPASGLNLYEQITFATMQILTGKAPATPNYNDKTETLTVGFMQNEVTPSLLGSARGTKTDVLCEFDGFYYASSSMCTATTAALAAVIVKEHPTFTAQCVIDQFINSAKRRNHVTAKTNDGKGYGVYKADDVIDFANTEGCPDLGFLPIGYYGNSGTYRTTKQYAQYMSSLSVDDHGDKVFGSFEEIKVSGRTILKGIVTNNYGLETVVGPIGTHYQLWGQCDTSDQACSSAFNSQSYNR